MFRSIIKVYVNNGLNCMKHDKVDEGRSILIQIYLKWYASFALPVDVGIHIKSNHSYLSELIQCCKSSKII